ncbi:ABC transporter ATP-binding protein [Dongia sedimenti]|uniref:ABC transporter ATP-binding protein n=1 Tax=Dongia sedimenti TaxID=3064282 RepID=A0ABU0YJS5_9PROT|nr:ABC transporter ATP-binding protein [Rhodospirillaceae bacterium R-7]
MTEDEVLGSSALANAFRVLRKHGLWRQVPLSLALVLAGFIEGLGITTLLPILRVIDNPNPGKLGQPEQIVFSVLDFLHLPHTLGALVLIFSLCMMVRAAISQQTSRFVGRIVAEIASELRNEVLDRLLQARWSYFTVNPVGRFVSAVSIEAVWGAYVYRTSLTVLAALIRAIIYCAIGLLIDWRAAVIAIVLGIGLGLINRFFTRAGRRAGRNQQLAMRGLLSDFGDVITGFKPLKAMSRHETLIKGLSKETKAIRRSMYDLVFYQQLANALPDLLINLVMVAAAYVCFKILGLDLSAMLVSGVIVLRLMANVSTVQRAIQETASSESFYWSLQATINEAREAAEIFTGKSAPALNDACRFDRVTFSYGAKPVLKDVSLEIPAGRITTLIGESGSGKTTIADLLLGLFVVDSGRITLDGVPLDEIDLLRWRSMVGYVPQEVLLFNGTIYDNIALGDPAISEPDVNRALEDAGALGFVKALPEGIHAPVGEHGAMLSGGQRQRIALARALVHRPALLILDEATSALDPETEAEICQTVQRQAGKLTVLAITHQPAWVTIADRVYRVIEGSVETTDGTAITPTLAWAKP